jgi:hypothetical protein
MTHVSPEILSMDALAEQFLAMPGNHNSDEEAIKGYTRPVFNHGGVPFGDVGVCQINTYLAHSKMITEIEKAAFEAPLLSPEVPC